ncbi:transcriptional regulator [Paraburkholderia ginsengiterrae]|uniref:Transcriptional regulator n=1 Tax=Paraburkholderia ginsengiterrae TaxID=1462993 RepID=A0A1A9N776_9BURK|nr:LysR family transcriptional regulator [Paraburkholderia ginsengiterrae]OAJ57366.1 transcriptional regulator [Paraburkholderia ginsengiterrae]OAJ58967.1 transcriptional regulator [Paraburkholderia ginsengiterrae]
MIDLRGIDLNLLVSLDVLLAEANVTRAAERLHLTQPAVSTQLARLRDMFGDPLLIPAQHGRGMTRSARAVELMEPLNAVLKQLETVVRRQPEFDPFTDSHRFTIAASDQAVAVLGLRLMEAWPEHAGPGVQLAFVAAEQSTPMERFERGEVDLLLGSERMVSPAMKARRLYNERFIVVQRKGHPRGAAPLDLDTYCALDHVLVSTSGGSFFGFVDEHLEALGRARRVALSVQHFTLVPDVLMRTNYVSTLPSRVVERHAGQLDAFELPFEAGGFTMFAAWHPRSDADPANMWLRDTLAKVAAR